SIKYADTFGGYRLSTWKYDPHEHGDHWHTILSFTLMAPGGSDAGNGRVEFNVTRVTQADGTIDISVDAGGAASTGPIDVSSGWRATYSDKYDSAVDTAAGFMASEVR